MEEQMFKQDAKGIVDMIFEGKLLKEDVTRDHMNSFEEYISFLLQSRFESYIKCEKVLKMLEAHKIKSG